MHAIAKLTPGEIAQKFLSDYNFQQAWLQVWKNKGCAGNDGETLVQFKANLETNLADLRNAIANSEYQPAPYKQILIPKGKEKYRELKVPSVRDRIAQQALLNILSPLIEPAFSACSFAYRPNLSYIQAVEKIAYWRDLGYQWVLDADIRQYFDEIDRARLLRELRKHIAHPGILCLIKAWITNRVATKNGLVATEKGIPQGAVISPLLANIYLDEFDRIIESWDVRLVRYADDFIILAKSKNRIKRAYTEVSSLLQAIALELHPQKTRITNFDGGFCFLGHGFIERAIFPVDKPKPNKKKTGKVEKAHITSQNFNPHLSKSLLKRETSDVSPMKVNKEELGDFQAAPQKNLWQTEMATIYLVEPGTSVYKQYQRFIIHVPEKDRLEIPIREVEKILIFGNINLSTPVISACLKSQISVLFLSTTAQYQGHLWSAEATNFNTEVLQLTRQQDKKFQFNVSQAIVYGKLSNSKQLLLRFNRKRKVAAVKQAISGITRDLEAITSVDNIDSLRGYEGISAARYFPALGDLIINPEFSFSQRNRQPPTDPVNSLLSFGYTLLFNNVLSLILAEGISPYLGNFHYGEHKKPYLAFDLMEEFRSPIVDSLVMRIISKSMLKKGNFEVSNSNSGVYLTNSGRRIFLKQFELQMNQKVSHPDIQSQVTYRHAIQLQVRRYKQSLFHSIPYQPFLRTA